MAKKELQDFKEDFALLIECGFIAVKQLDETSATRIFSAAQVMSPNNTAPQIGLGYIHLNKLELKKASEIFESVLAKEPENYLAQTFLGMSYLLTKPKRKKGEKLVREAMEKSMDPTIKNLGELTLDWADKELKGQKKTPFFVNANEGGDKEEEEA